MKKLSIESDRLVMRSLDAADTEQFFDFLIRNTEFFRKWSPEYEPNYFSVWYHKAWLEIIEKEFTEGRQIKFGAYLKDNMNTIIGTVSFSNIIKGVFLSCYLGYRFDEKHINKGYATEAISRGVAYVFETLGLHRVEANIMPSNFASIRTIEKCGFENEGLSRKYLKIDGIWEDHYHFVKLNEKA